MNGGINQKSTGTEGTSDHNKFFVGEKTVNRGSAPFFTFCAAVSDCSNLKKRGADPFFIPASEFKNRPELPINY
jgi:hypothetical protein